MCVEGGLVVWFQVTVFVASFSNLLVLDERWRWGGLMVVLKVLVAESDAMVAMVAQHVAEDTKNLDKGQN